MHGGSVLLALTLLLVAELIGIFALAKARNYDVVPVETAVFIGRWTPLSADPWVRASSGWVAMGNSGTPKVDASFIGTPLAVGDREFSHGIGAYAPSEVVYELKESSALFSATIGVNREAPPGQGSVVFRVFLDDVAIYRSPPIAGGEPPRAITVPVAGPARLRLVADPGPGPALSAWNLATWGEASLFDSVVVLGAPQEIGILVSATRTRLGNAARRVQAERRLSTETAARLARLPAIAAPDPDGGASAGFDARRGEWLLANRDLAVALGVEGVDRGRLSVLRLTTSQLLVDRASPSVVVAGRALRLADASVPLEEIEIAPVDVPPFGSGIALAARFAFGEDGTDVLVRVTVLDATPALLLQIEPVSAPTEGVTYRYLEGRSVLLGDRAEYLTDVSRIRSGVVRDDGRVYREAIDFGKPLLLWGGRLGEGLLLATVDETDRMSEFTALLAPGEIQADFTFQSRRSRPMGAAPRLYLEVTGATHPREAFRLYREAMVALYPARPLPAWARYQWSSWYVYYMAVTDAAVRAHVDYIATRLADLGPWHVVIDAGWYVAEGRPHADFRNVDRDKFPDGLRPVVDYAHSRGVKVVLYLSVPYVDSGVTPGDWLGLKGLIEEQRECLVPLGGDQTRAAYTFDFARACTREYWGALLEDYFVRYDVDGILIDGLGQAGGALISPPALDSFGLVDRVVYQSVDIYRFMGDVARQHKPDAYVEAGWHLPLMAHPHANAYWVDDTDPRFTSTYPFGGLVEDIDYAAFQRVALGQPPHMGVVAGDVRDNRIARWWLEASLAMAALVPVSVNLPLLGDAGLGELRARLVHHRPFEGRTFVDDPRRASVFGTLRDGLAFVGLLNRDVRAGRVEGRLGDFGLRADRLYTVYEPEQDTARRVQGTITQELPPQTFRLAVIPTRPGAVWTSSSFRQETRGRQLRIRLGGPASVAGFAVVYAPGLQSVSLDGEALRARPPGLLGALQGGDYDYDEETGILRIRYEHNRTRVLTVGL